MKPENRYRYMTWALVALAVLNITTVLAIFYYRNQDRQGPNIQEHGTIQSENTSLKFSGRYFRDQLNLSSEQMERFREFNPEFRRQVMEINLRLNDIRKKMLAEMSSPVSNNASLDLLSDSVGYLHADLKKLTYRYYLDFKEICNNDQKEKLDQLFGEMFAADSQAGHYGPGPHGRGRGRRFNN